MLKNRSQLLLMFAIAAMAAAIITPAAASAATSCAPGKTLWVVGGKPTCLKSASLNGPAKASPEADRAAAMIKGLAKPVPGSKFRLPKGFKRALPAAARSAQKLVTKALTTPFKPDPKKKSKAAGIAGSPVTDTMTMDSPTIQADGGVAIKVVATMRKHADDSIDAELKYEITKGKDTIVVTPEFGALGKGIPDVNCPTADGILKITDTDNWGHTAVRKRGNKVMQAITERTTKTIQATGHVGRDAKLESVDAKVTMKTEHYERGMQLVINYAGNLAITREGNPTLSGPMSATPKIKVAGVSAKQEKAWGEQATAHYAADKEAAGSMGASIDVARWRMLQDEYKWYQLPNYCAKIATNPDSVALISQGQSKVVEGVVRAEDGGESPGAFTVDSVSRGGYSLIKAESDPGAPAKFNATGGQPASDKTTVEASMIATSKGGRAQGSFYAETDPIKVPNSFSGALTSTSTTPGLLDEFSMIATWELQSKTPGPNGFAQAWYELTEVILESSKNEIGAGCRWVATGTNGTINAGDLELRRAGTDAPWTYAFMVDVSVLDATFMPTDCPPEAGVQPFTGDIVSVLNSHQIGAPFRPVDVTATDFRMIEQDQSDVIGPGNLDTVASWAIYSYS